MSHEITASLNGIVIANFGRGAGNGLNIAIYRILNVIEFYGQSSGLGRSKSFTQQELVAAMDRYYQISRMFRDPLEPEKELLLSALEFSEPIVISFY